MTCNHEVTWRPNTAFALGPTTAAVLWCAFSLRHETLDVVSCSMCLCEDVATGAELFCGIGVFCTGH